jgi:hypothetical protein
MKFYMAVMKNVAVATQDEDVSRISGPHEGVQQRNHTMHGPHVGLLRESTTASTAFFTSTLASASILRIASA